MYLYFIRLLALPFCVCMILSCSKTVPPEWTKEGIKADDMKHIEAIQPGATREELLKVFKRTGGISSAAHAQFLYEGHPSVAVDVQFQCQLDKMGRRLPHPQDRIISISAPYIIRDIRTNTSREATIKKERSTGCLKYSSRE